MRLRTWVRTLFRTERASACAPSRTHSARPALEVLEERLVLSTTAPDPLAHQLWRDARFRVDDQPVASIAPKPRAQDTSTTAANTSFGTQIGLDKAFANYSFRGTGYTVAVIDTGIDYTHPDLGGGWGKRVVAGYDFVNNDADPMDDNGHGTHLAGIIGSSSTTYPGVAPNVNLLAVKVLDSSNNGDWPTIEKGLKWVIANQAKYHIVAVNLSLGSGNYTVNPYGLLEDDFATLKTLGVFTAVASGNRFFTYNSQPGVGYPATSTNVVSVGAVWTGNFGKVVFGSGATDFTTEPDRIVSFTQRDSALSLLAPGAWIVSTAPGGGYQTMGGTSMATAVVTGAATLVHQAYDVSGAGNLATQDTILNLMRNTGVTVKDGDDENDNVVNTGLSFKRLNLQAALAAVPQPPKLAPIANQTLKPGTTFSVGLSASDPNRDVITFSARVTDDRAMAYYFDQTLGLKYLGSYYTNVRGFNEKWLSDAKGNWFGIFPSGEFRRWAGTMTETMKSANLWGTLGVAYYNDPSLLWNAPAAQYPPVSLTIAGNILTIKPLAAVTSPFVVDVTATDGTFSVKQRFTVTPASAVNSAPVLASIANQSLAKGVTSQAVPISASDANGDALSITARALASDSAAYQLDQRLGLMQYNNSYYTSLLGQNEKWLLGSGGIWYVLLTDGRLYRYEASYARTVVPANWVASFDTTFYAEPRLLWDAKPSVAPALTLTVQNGQLIVQRPASLVGVFFIEVTASDGQAAAKRTFMLTLN
jgi:subtilisin family serine protease